MGGQTQTQIDRLFEPEQMIDNATNILNHMRLQHGRNEEKAVNAALFITIETLAWLIVKATPNEAKSVEVATKITEHLADVMIGLNSVRGGDGIDLPAYTPPEYADDFAKRGRS